MTIERHGSGITGLVIDNFAGGGGASTGIEDALGRPVDYAINHDPEALAMHRVNHPATHHLNSNVWDVNPAELCAGRPVDLGWFSPDCTYHSKARGGKPFRDRDTARRRRGLAWLIPYWMKTVRPSVVMLENVEEFADWGPLLPDGKICPIRRGMTFRRWHKQIENLGYQIDMRELRACDYGAPTTRKRLFVIARCDGQEIVFPEATHGPWDGCLPYRTAAECIDWSIPCPSIFTRKKPLADATLRRIAKGIMRYVVNNPRPFIVPLTHHGERRAHPLDELFPVVTGANRGELALIAPVFTECANASSPRCMPGDEPLRTICSYPKGGHHALVSAFLAKHYGDSGQRPGSAMDEPVGTITTVDHHSLVTSHLVHLRNNCDARSVTDLFPTLTAGGGHVGEVRAFLLKFYGNEKEAHSLDNPMGTVTTKDRFGLVTVHGEQYCIVDIGMRMLTPRELYRAQSFPDSYIIDHGIDDQGERLPLTKTAQVRMCGNSVSPAMSRALVQANVVDQAEESTFQLRRVRG